MKGVLSALIFSALSASAQVQVMTGEQRYDYYKSRGLSLEKVNPKRPIASAIDYKIGALPDGDPRIQAAFDSLVASFGKRRVKNTSGDPFKPGKLLAPATLEEFFDLLKMGEIFDIVKGTANIECMPCQGWGRVTDKGKGLRTGDGKVECDKCDGEGKFTVPQPVRVRW